jgi:hypothetical protein
MAANAVWLARRPVGDDGAEVGVDLGAPFQTESVRYSAEDHRGPEFPLAPARPQVSERRQDGVLVAAGHPPMTGVNLNGRGSRGPAGLLPLGEGADVVVTARDDSQARPAGGGRQIPPISAITGWRAARYSARMQRPVAAPRCARYDLRQGACALPETESVAHDRMAGRYE